MTIPGRYGKFTLSGANSLAAYARRLHQTKVKTVNIQYQVVDVQTKNVIATKDNSQAARRLADKRDSQYGAVRYIVRQVQTGQPLPVSFAVEIPLAVSVLAIS